MKKYHLYLWLVALVGLMTSCSQDETDALQTATDANRLTLTASLPADFVQIGTRALPSAKNHQLRCILEVWTKDASPVLKYREEKSGLSGDNVVFEFTIDNATYDCLFWADFIATNAATDASAKIGDVTYTHYADKYYATNTDNGLRAVSITGTDYVKDGEFTSDARDAFFSHAELQKEAGKSGTLSTSLTRPFAKLIIKEKTKDAYNLCKYMTAASYTVPKTFNVLTGIASGNYSVSPDEIYQTGNVSIDDFTLFSDLIFTSSAGRETLGQISLAFAKQDSNPTELQPVTIPAGVPIQRNYKTNASGNLISEKSFNDAKVTVTMNTGWNGTDINDDLDE
jgi:hypothetical protein